MGAGNIFEKVGPTLIDAQHDTLNIFTLSGTRYTVQHNLTFFRKKCA